MRARFYIALDLRHARPPIKSRLLHISSFSLRKAAASSVISSGITQLACIPHISPSSSSTGDPMSGYFRGSLVNCLHAIKRRKTKINIQRIADDCYASLRAWLKQLIRVGLPTHGDTRPMMEMFMLHEMMLHVLCKHCILGSRQMAVCVELLVIKKSISSPDCVVSLKASSIFPTFLSFVSIYRLSEKVFR